MPPPAQRREHGRVSQSSTPKMLTVMDSILPDGFAFASLCGFGHTPTNVSPSVAFEVQSISGGGAARVQLPEFVDLFLGEMFYSDECVLCSARADQLVKLGLNGRAVSNIGPVAPTQSRSDSKRRRSSAILHRVRRHWTQL
jgi:hypothetical protein